MLARVVRQVSKNVARTVSGPFPIRAFSAMEKTEKVSPRGLKALIAKELKYETENPADNGADYEEAKKSVLKNFNISQKSGKGSYDFAILLCSCSAIVTYKLFISYCYFGRKVWRGEYHCFIQRHG